jgi:hypothetical protein
VSVHKSWKGTYKQTIVWPFNEIVSVFSALSLYPVNANPLTIRKPIDTRVNKTVAQISFHFGISTKKASLKLNLSLVSGFIGEGW